MFILEQLIQIAKKTDCNLLFLYYSTPNCNDKSLIESLIELSMNHTEDSNEVRKLITTFLKLMLSHTVINRLHLQELFRPVISAYYEDRLDKVKFVQMVNLLKEIYSTQTPIQNAPANYYFFSGNDCMIDIPRQRKWPF